MGLSYIAAAGNPPVVTSLAWKLWYTQLLAARLSYSPSARATTYFFAANGNDTSGNGSAASPYATLAKAQTLLAANVRLRFRRGDIFYSNYTQNGLTILTPHVTIDDWGSSANPKPIFSRFNTPYTTGQWSAVTGTANSRCWQLSETASIAWLRETSSVNSIYRKMTSITSVDATPGSWWQDTTAHLLYINPMADIASSANPTSGVRQFESVTANTNTGIAIGQNSPAISVDDVLIQNIRVDGFTANLTDQGGEGITGFLSGTDSLTMRGVEVYYSDRHNIANTSPANTGGGIITFYQCKYGWTASPTGRGPTVVYSPNGTQEALWHECETVGDALPIGAAPYAGATNDSPGQFCHTDGAAGHNVSLMIAYGCFNRTGQWQSGIMSSTTAAPSWSDIANCKVFVVNETFNAREVSPLDAAAAPPSANVNGNFGVVGRIIPGANTAFVNCKFVSRMVFDLNPYNQRPFIQSSNLGVMINCSVLFDGIGSQSILWQLPREMFDACTATLYNCRLHIRTYGTTQLSIGTLGSFNSPASSVSNINTFNTILSADGVGGGVGYYSVGFGNVAANQSNNAYSNASLAHKTAAEGYDQDPYYVEVSDLPFGHPYTDSPLLSAHNQLVQGVYRLEYDADWNPRSLSSPAIGPYEPVAGALALTSAQSGGTEYSLGASFSADGLPVGFAVFSISPGGTATLALARSTVGVVNPGGGKYHQSVTLPVGFKSGYTLADDGAGNYATDSINIIAPTTLNVTSSSPAALNVVGS
jgi:hypothetical protein